MRSKTVSIAFTMRRIDKIRKERLRRNDVHEMEIDSEGETQEWTAQDTQGSLPNLADIEETPTDPPGQPGEDGEDSEFILPEGASEDIDFRVPENMDTSGGSRDTVPPDVEMAAASSSAGATLSQMKETPISTYPKLEYGLPNTHTTILPFRTYCSFGMLDHVPLRLELRMNSVYDMMVTSCESLGAGATIDTKSFRRNTVGPGGKNVGANTDFPAFPGAGAHVTERPQWRDYWARLYSHYTVLGCKYRITVLNSSNVRGGDVEIAEHMDSFTDASTATGNVTPAAPYYQMKAYKNIKWHVIPASTVESLNSHVQVISGTYKPGMIRHNIVNDGDVKTWTTTSNAGGGTAPIPALKDLLVLDFYRAGLNYAPPKDACGNICIELDYIVQFKDLYTQARWPSSVTTGVNIAQSIHSSPDLDDVRAIP